MDAEIAPVPEMAQRLVGDAPQPDLQGRAVVDDRGDVARDALRDLAGLRMTILRHRHIDLHQGIDAVEMDEALAVGARHRRIDLRDHAARDAEHRRREVHGHPEADEAAGIGRGDLKQRHVDRQQPARQERRHLLEGDGHIVELAAAREASDVAADEEHPMAVAGPGRARRHRQRRRRDEADELEVGRTRLHRFQPRKQGPRRRTAGAEINAAARPDRGQRPLQADELRAGINGGLAGHVASRLPAFAHET